MKACKLVALSEDESGRERAKKFCNALMDRFWTQYEFEVSWFTFADLADMKRSTASAHEAGQTDMVIVACSAESQMPTDVQLWVEQWIAHRSDREGCLVGLVESPANLCSGRETYLRNVARRGGLDFLTEIPDTLLGALPEDLTAASQRATHISGVLEDILTKPITPRTLPLPTSKF